MSELWGCTFQTQKSSFIYRYSFLVQDGIIAEYKNVSRGTFLLLRVIHFYQELIISLQKGNILALKSKKLPGNVRIRNWKLCYT